MAWRFFFSCLIVFPVALWAQDSWLFNNTFFQNYNMKNGLKSNYCYDVLQDSRGYIWVATLNGLNKFNGNNWSYFQQQSTLKKHITNANWVIDIDEEKDKGIWINTDRGIAFYEFKTDSVTKFVNPIKGWGKISAIGNNQIIVSSWTGIDLFEVKNNELKLQKHFTETEQNSFPTLYKDWNGNCWTCPEDQPSLVVINPATQSCKYLKSITYKGQNTSIVINNICQISADTFLLATKKYGVLKYVAKLNQAIDFLPAKLSNKNEYACISTYTINNTTYYLIGSKNAGLFIVNQTNGEVYNQQNNYTLPYSLTSNHVTAIHADNNQGFWVATTMGLSYFHPSLQKNKLYSFYNHAVIPESVVINCVYNLTPTNYLIGTDAGGLFAYNAETNHAFCATKGKFSNAQITSIAQTDLGILVGSNYGLLVYLPHQKQCIPFTLGHKTILNFVHNVKQLTTHLLAVCTADGLILINTKTGKINWNEPLKNSTHSEKLICKDALYTDGKLWVLRFFDGWQVFDFASQKCIYQSVSNQQLPLDYHNLTQDKNYVYISTTAGIIKQHKNMLNTVNVLKTNNGLAGDEIENALSTTDTTLLYTTPDGLYSYDLRNQSSTRMYWYENYIQKWHNQLSQTNFGYVYTVSNYFLEYNNSLGYKNYKTPSLTFESIFVNQQAVNITSDSLELNYNQNNITFNLAGLVYPNADKNYWTYKLNKLDTNTIVCTNGTIELHNLPPDDYIISITSYNNEGTSSAQPKTFFIKINQPFYSTWWFLTAVIALVIGILVFIVWYRNWQHQQLLLIRNQISRDLHDELGANVSSINIMANMLLNRVEHKTDQVLINISNYSVQISDTINDIIWNVNPNFDSIDELIKRMTRFASETIDASGITYSITLPETPHNYKLNNKVKYHLYLIFKEAINNAVKHAKANQLNITIQLTANEFAFCISDNGIGFVDKEIEKGNGLNNIKSRSEEIKANLTITSTHKNGTTVKLSIKL